MRSKIIPLTRIVGYSKNIESLVQQIRTFSSKLPNDSGAVSKGAHHEHKVFLGPRDSRTPLPGNVGTAQFYLTSSYMPSDTKPWSPPVKTYADVIKEDAIMDDKQKNILTQFLSSTFEAESSAPSVSQVLECVAQVCPTLLKKDLACMFTNKDLMSMNVTVLTLCQKTEHDMSAWGQAMDLERQMLTAHFVVAAQEICVILTKQGYWADFIDPDSGRPFNGPYTTATFFETDERYRQLGFKIEDLGCCKVITHNLWGTHTFVGSLFTDAPLESPEVQDILAQNQ